MIVKHSQKDAGTQTEYRMAMGRPEFIIFLTLLQLKIAELDKIAQDNPEIEKYYALLRIMELEMSREIL